MVYQVPFGAGMAFISVLQSAKDRRDLLKSFEVRCMSLDGPLGLPREAVRVKNGRLKTLINIACCSILFKLKPRFVTGNEWTYSAIIITRL
jgi:hypothetical protein